MFFSPVIIVLFIVSYAPKERLKLIELTDPYQARKVGHKYVVCEVKETYSCCSCEL